MAKKSNIKPNIVDKTKKVTTLQIISRTAICVVALGIVYLASFLEILIRSYVAMTVILCIVGAFLGIMFGLAPGLGSYTKKEDKDSICYARTKPLHIASLFFILPGIAFAVMYVIGLIEQGARPETLEPDNLVPVFLGMAICSFLYAGFTQIAIVMDTCPDCGAFNSHVEVGKSDVKTTTRIETKDVTYSGSSYDVYSGGTHVGTVRGSDSHGKETREVTTREWEVYCECIYCGHKKSVKESDTEKGKWS